jgi:YbbR domain-containing protein
MINALRNIFFRDFWLKLFSLVLATLIWLIVYLFAIKQDVAPSAALRNTNLKEHSLENVPVLVVSSAADVRDFRVNPANVTVKVRGDRRDIETLQPSDIHALVDLTGIESASNLTKKISVTVPANITFISAEPDSVEVIIPPKP